MGFAEAQVHGCTSLAEFPERFPPGRPVAPGFLMLSEDPRPPGSRSQRTRGTTPRTYAAWQEDGVVSDWAVPGAEHWQQLRDSGNFAVVTPEECRALATRDGHLMLHPLMGGIDPELAWESLRLLERWVLKS